MGSTHGDVESGRPATALDFWRQRVLQSGSETAFLHRRAPTQEYGQEQGQEQPQPQEWRKMTWAEADRIAREIAAGLIALGVGPGDSVGLLSQTRLEWVLCDVGIVLCGAVSVPIYPSSTAAQCEHIIVDAGAKVVIAEDAAQTGKLVPLLGRPGTVSHLVQIERDAMPDTLDAASEVGAAPNERLQSLDALRSAGRTWLSAGINAAQADGAQADSLQARAAVTPDSPFTIIYTSGTTGAPKGVVLTHGNLTCAIDSAISAFTIRDDDEQYLLLPLAHVLGRELEWVAVRVGGRTWFSEGLSRIKENLVETRPTFLAGVPRIFEKMHAGVLSALAKAPPTRRRLFAWALALGKAVRGNARPATRESHEGKTIGAWLRFQHALAERMVFRKLRARLGLDRCRFIISGGAPLAPEIAEMFHACGLLILEGYGLTETMAAACVNRPERFRFGTVGPAIDVVELKIAEDGEVLMRGPSVFRRYHNNPSATADAIDADGWFHSGDIGRLEDDFLRITDRKKDIIITAGGKNVAPQPIENAIKLQCPLLSQVVVYGDRRPYCVALCTLSERAVEQFGQFGSAQAIARSPALLAAIQIDIDSVNARLAGFETIKRFAILPADFTEASGEMTPSLKVKRKVVVEKHRSVIDGLYGDHGDPLPQAGDRIAR
jgi:long-chain acyl-CoA synthetase